MSFPLPSVVDKEKAPKIDTRSWKITSRKKKVWVDLENSPHVPFFKPIIEELRKSGYEVIVTARDCFQVCDLADLFGLEYKRVGRHYGKHTAAKIAGLLIRVAQMAPTMLREKPDLAISHGSRSLFVLSAMLHIPTITIFDYEHARWVKFIKPSWVMAPELIPEQSVCAIGISKDRILRYPGIKEDVYAPFFRPDPTFKKRIGLDDHSLVVTLRPPATEAHYHNPESEKLLDATLELLGSRPDTKVVILPRTKQQETALRRAWSAMFEKRQFMVPVEVLDGLDMIWHSDLVVSGGGTMNREAAALGVPVYSIFRGKIGAVDRYLAETGRLVLLESTEDIGTKIRLERRSIPSTPNLSGCPALQAVVDNITGILEKKC